MNHGIIEEPFLNLPSTQDSSTYKSLYCSALYFIGMCYKKFWFVIEINLSHKTKLAGSQARYGTKQICFKTENIYLSFFPAIKLHRWKIQYHTVFMRYWHTQNVHLVSQKWWSHFHMNIASYWHFCLLCILWVQFYQESRSRIAGKPTAPQLSWAWMQIFLHAFLSYNSFCPISNLFLYAYPAHYMHARETVYWSG